MHRSDALTVLAALRKRMKNHGLELHSEKRVVNSLKSSSSAPGNRFKKEQDQIFDFLGFTIHWRKSRRGEWVVGPKTRKCQRSLPKSGSGFAATGTSQAQHLLTSGKGPLKKGPYIP